MRPPKESVLKEKKREPSTEPRDRPSFGAGEEGLERKWRGSPSDTGGY